MVDSNLHVVVILTQTVGFILLLEVLTLKSIEFLSELVLLVLFDYNQRVQLFSLLALPLEGRVPPSRLKNLDGLRAMIRDGLSPSAPEQPLGPNGRGARRRVARGPAIVVRDGPSESAPVVGARRCGAEVLCLAERDGWVRVAGGGPDAEGWARADGIA